MDTYKDAVVLDDLWRRRAAWRLWDRLVERREAGAGHRRPRLRRLPPGARRCCERGEAVRVLDAWRAPTRPVSGLELQGIGDEVELLEADLRDADGVAAAIAAGEFDAVFHLAAQTIVGPGAGRPDETFEVNVRGTWNVFEACRRAEVPAVVFASSDKAYGPSDELPYREDFPLRAGLPYEASKAAADTIALGYRLAYGLPLAVTRFANVYGGGDLNFTRLIPEAIAGAARRAGAPQIRSDGSPERDFLHVERRRLRLPGDRAAVGAGDAGAARPSTPAASGRTRSARWSRRSARASGGELEPEFRGPGNPAGEIADQYLDSTKLRELTGWAPRVDSARTAWSVPWSGTANTRRCFPDVRPLHGHHQRHEDDRRPLPGRAREGAGTRAAAAAKESRQGRRTAKGDGEEKAPPGLGRFNVAPTQEILVVRSSPDARGGGRRRPRGEADALGPGPGLGQGPESRLPDDQRQNREPD